MASDCTLRLKYCDPPTPTRKSTMADSSHPSSSPPYRRLGCLPPVASPSAATSSVGSALTLRCWMRSLSSHAPIPQAVPPLTSSSHPSPCPQSPPATDVTAHILLPPVASSTLLAMTLPPPLPAQCAWPHAFLQMWQTSPLPLLLC